MKTEREKFEQWACEYFGYEITQIESTILDLA